jgi:imidazolonepropionase-like amidohydrolase
MKRTVLFAILLVLAPTLGAQQLKVLQDVTVIDVKAGKAVPHQDVLISGLTIKAVQNTSEPPKDATVLHRGGYVIPGLWDMHVHLAGINADPKWSGDVLLPQLLKYGITTVRDMGGDLEALKRWRAEISAGTRVGPTLYFAGPMLAAQPSTSVDQRTVQTADQARQAVDDLKAQGADFIKILHIPRAAYFPLAEEAKKQNISFVGHLPFGVTVQEAAEAGQKSIEHINWSVLAIDCSAHPKETRVKVIAALQGQDDKAYEKVLDEAAANFDETSCASVAQAMTQHGTVSVPTLVSEEIAANVTTHRPDESYLKLLPQKLQQDWSADKLLKDNPSEHVAWLQRQLKSDLCIAAFLHAHGVEMLAGSDSLDTMTFPGPTLQRELQLLVQIGMTPAEALRAATFDSAKFMGKDAESGTIEPGKTADLVVLSANPLEEIGNTGKIEAVIVRGTKSQ